MSSNPLSEPTTEPHTVYDMALLDLSRLRLGDDHEAVHGTLMDASRIIATTLGVSRVGVWFFLDKARAIRCDFLYQHGDLHPCEGTILHAADFPAYFQAMASSRVVPVTGADVMARELRDTYLAPLGITAMLDAPIYRGGRIVGIVCHEHTGPPREWTDSECRFATSVGDIAGRLCEEAARRRAQQRLQRYETQVESLQRMSAMGRLAAGLAHDFNNVLAAVLGYSELIRVRAAGDAEIREMTRELDTAAENGRRLAERLFAYGRQDSGQPRVVSPGEVVRRAAALVRATLGPEVALEVSIDDGVGRVFIDPADLERMVVNLGVNAGDAMPQGGTITLRLSEALPPATAEGYGLRHVLLEVRDTGRGIDPTIRERVLEPFFTTKGDKGTGLGLAIVHQTATRAGGFVDIESEVGLGTAVRVYLPRIGEAD